MYEPRHVRFVTFVMYHITRAITTTKCWRRCSFLTGVVSARVEGLAVRFWYRSHGVCGESSCGCLPVVT